MLQFIELKPFSSVRDRYIDDDEFTALQLHLAAYPDVGDVIPQSGGCRKLRWIAPGRGKRGGIRVIYFLRLEYGQIVLITLYAKNVQDNINPQLLNKIKEDFHYGQNVSG